MISSSNRYHIKPILLTLILSQMSKSELPGGLFCIRLPSCPPS